MERLVKIFRKVFRETVDNQLLAYEEEVMKGFEREVREHREVWEKFERLPDETVEELLKWMLEFVMKEVYPKTALARLEREIVGVKEKVEEIGEKVDKHHEYTRETAKEAGRVIAIVENEIKEEIHEAKKGITRELEVIKEDVLDIRKRTEYIEEVTDGVKDKLGVKTSADRFWERLERRAEIEKAVLNERDPYDDDPLYRF